MSTSTSTSTSTSMRTAAAAAENRVLRPARFTQAIQRLQEARAGLRLWLQAFEGELPAAEHSEPIQLSLRALAEGLQAASNAFFESTRDGLTGDELLLAFGLVNMAESAVWNYGVGETEQPPAVHDLRLTVAHALAHVDTAHDQAQRLQLQLAQAGPDDAPADALSAREGAPA